MYAYDSGVNNGRLGLLAFAHCANLSKLTSRNRQARRVVGRRMAR